MSKSHKTHTAAVSIPPAHNVKGLSVKATKAEPKPRDTERKKVYHPPLTHLYDIRMMGC